MRTIHCGDGLEFLRNTEFTAGHAFITSMPDVSELAPMKLPEWKKWFTAAAQLVCERAHPDAMVIFFQTDIKADGHWVDKGYLVTAGAEAAGSHCLWHKIVCRASPGIVTFGRPAYAHMLAFSKNLKLEKGQASADVIAQLGDMPWARAMGVAACVEAVRFLKKHTSTHTVVDPFCGLGTVLAVAEKFELNAVGVELSAKRAKRAQTLEVKLPL